MVVVPRLGMKSPAYRYCRSCPASRLPDKHHLAYIHGKSSALGPSYHVYVAAAVAPGTSMIYTTLHYTIRWEKTRPCAVESDMHTCIGTYEGKLLPQSGLDRVVPFIFLFFLSPRNKYIYSSRSEESGSAEGPHLKSARATENSSRAAPAFYL